MTKKLVIYQKRFNLIIKQCYLIDWSVEKNTESRNPKIVKANNGKMMLLSKWAVCGNKKLSFIKE